MTEQSNKHRVVFQPSGKQGYIDHGTTVLEAARQLGVGIENICGGRQTCAKCRVTVGEGNFAKYALESSADSVTPVQPIEESYRHDRQIRADERLACIAQMCADAVINVPPEAQAQKQVVRKEASDRPMTVNPAVRQLYIEVQPPDLGDRRSDLERVQDALREQWDMPSASIDVKLLGSLGKVLRSGDWRTTVTIWSPQGGDHEIIRLKPGYSEGLYGLAVDLGTTSIAAYLCDLRTGEVVGSETAMNPQIAYGEDLMSRVSYGMMNLDGAEKMHRAVIKTLNEVAAGAAKRAGLRTDDIIDMVLVANPIMHHLFYGIDPVELGGAPFALTIRDLTESKARDLGLKINPCAYVCTLPCQAGHVGADCTAVALAERPDLRDELTLIVDVGTNAEILLGNRDGVYSASSPTGPAFEGAQIAYGQRAAPGAIERVRIDPNTWTPRFRVIGRETWSDADVDTGATGICGSGIIEAVAELFLAGIISGDGRFVEREHPRLSYTPESRKRAYLLATADQSATGSPIYITQDDVRAIQLAKAALYAGVKLLMLRSGITHIDRIKLAGAFGSYIDPKYAMILGLIPDCALDQVGSVGNAAGDGARIALLDHTARQDSERLARAIHYVETATDPDFQDAFVNAIHIPNAVDSFPHLADLLPARSTTPRPSRRRASR